MTPFLNPFGVGTLGFFAAIVYFYKVDCLDT